MAWIVVCCPAPFWKNQSACEIAWLDLAHRRGV
jgi:hypothetical protein